MKYEFFEVKDVKEYILGLSKEQLVNEYDSLDKYIRTNPLLTGMDIIGCPLTSYDRN